MQYDFDEIIDRSGTYSLKHEYARAVNPLLPADAVQLWVADMDFACPPPILAAMRRRLDRRILGYTVTDALSGYGDAVCGWMRRRYGWAVQPEQLLFSDGVVSALYAAVERLTKPGDEVLLLTPAYHPFHDAILHYGRTPLLCHMHNDSGHFTVDWDDLAAKAARASCTLCFFCNPQNPTGRVFTEAELKRAGDILFGNDVFVVCDEIHADLLRAGQTHTPLAKLFPNEKRILTCTAPSKTFNIAGNRHANLVIPDPSVYDDWAENALLGHPGALTVEAVIAAYGDPASEEWLTQLCAYLDGNFAMMRSLLAERLPKVVFRIPEGTYLGWVDLSAYGLPEETLNERASKAGVFVQFGKDFVDNADCFARINAACPRSVLREGLTRLASAIG